MSSIKGSLSKFVGIVLFVALVGVLSPSVHAQVTNLSDGGSVNFSNLVGTNGLSVMIGDKLFANFGFQYTDTSGNMGDYLNASDLVLSALSNQVGFGVSIQVPLVSVGPVIKDLTLMFSAQVTNSNNLISDLHLDFTGSASGNGIAAVDESVYTNGFGTGNLANLSLTLTSAGYVPLSGQTNVTFIPPESKIWIDKDVFVSGNPDDLPDGNPPSDFASISIIDQTFSQIPEPSTMALLGVGMAGLLIVRRRK
jgi:hypothetical protein